MEKSVIEKIKKLLNMTLENGASENEATIAALQAQKLMAKHNIQITDLEGGEVDKIFHAAHEGGKGYKWRYSLSSIVARNFRCKVYTLGRDQIVFFGYESDAIAARETFSFLFNTGNKLAARYYNERKKLGDNTKGLLNSYLLGFCKGIAEALDKQCKALMIVTPKEVNEQFDIAMANAKTRRNTMNVSNTKAYETGKTDGKNTMAAKQLT